MRRRIWLPAAAVLLLTGCSANAEAERAQGLSVIGRMPLEYAEQFSVEYCADGCSVIHIGADDFLLVPESCAVPAHPDMTVIRQPVESIYLAASSAMDLFDALGGLDAVTLTSTDRSGWSLPHIQAAMDADEITFIGKYSAPDYEALTESDCTLAIESTMIYHSPAVKEQIEMLGIPVIVERSSYETHPLGRMEWMKLYGLLLGNYDEAEAYFEEKTNTVLRIDTQKIPEEARKTCAFFSITANGAVTIRKPGDYISQMIALAGGRYIFTAEQLNLDENALSTMTVQMETFYETAKDADILIYNSTIEGNLENLEQLLAKSSVLSDFRAVQNGNVWCTEQNMFQQTTGAADMIRDLSRIFSDEADDTEQLTFLHRLL